MADTNSLAETLTLVAEDLESSVTPPEPVRRRRGFRDHKSSERAPLMQIVEDDGVLHVVEAEGGSARTDRPRRRELQAAETKYEREFERLDNSQIGAWLEALDRKLTPQRGLRRLSDAGLVPLQSVPSHGRMLLFIHGTFSESDAFFKGFEENPLGSTFLDWARGHYSDVITFDHPTLSASPILNARQLAILLAASQAEIDVVCHSRGGLVTRWWLEVLDRRPHSNRRAIFVGSPLAGTGLASPANLRGSLSLLSNLGTALGVATAGIPFLTVLTGLFRVVTSVTRLAAKTPAIDAAVSLVPGLSAQSRVGNNAELLSLREVHDLSLRHYFAIQSNFESEDPGWKFWRYFRDIGQRGKDFAADLVFDGPNDLVVDTGSMVDIARELRIPEDNVFDYCTTDHVHHTNYFAQKETLAFIREKLSRPPSSTGAVTSVPAGRLQAPLPTGDRDVWAPPGSGPKKEPELPTSLDESTDASNARDRKRRKKSPVDSPSSTHKPSVRPQSEKSAPAMRGARRRPKSRAKINGTGHQQNQQQQQRIRQEQNWQQRQELPSDDPTERGRTGGQQSRGSAPITPHDSTLRRTPKLALDRTDAVAPGTVISVSVWADRQPPQEGTETEDIIISLPQGQQRVTVDTHLVVSPQLEVIQQPLQHVEIGVAEEASSIARFQVRVRSREAILRQVRQLPSVSRASVSAMFSYNGRPSGSVTRIVGLDLDFQIPDAPNVRQRSAIGTVRVEPEAELPDVIVQIRAQPINDGRQFQCKVTTKLIEIPEEDYWEDWNLPGIAESIVRGYMNDFIDADASPLERLSLLKGAGRQLFEAAPKNFKSVYWKLVDSDRVPASIAVVSDEPYIPWELMIPHRRRDGRSESRAPLGVSCAIGRWVLGDGSSGVQRLPLSDSIVVAPRYEGENALPHAEEEAKYVLDNFKGIRIEPAVLEEIRQVLAEKRGSILHFSCHGADPDTDSAQAVYLEDGRVLTTVMLEGLDSVRNALEDRPTLVLINACEIGRPRLALVGIGGFAQTFINLGAAGVVAALWSVRDDLAHTVAMEFYESVVSNPTRAYADILREIRARAYDEATGAEDTFAAYCFYGDPLACAAP